MNYCRCHHIYHEGSFQIGKEYAWTFVIDGINVIDDNGNVISFDEISFLWYFTKLKNKS